LNSKEIKPVAIDIIELRLCEGIREGGSQSVLEFLKFCSNFLEWVRNDLKTFSIPNLYCLSPLVFSAIGGMGPVATTVYRKLASLLARKWKINYSCCLFQVRFRLCYSSLRSGVMRLKGYTLSNVSKC